MSDRDGQGDARRAVTMEDVAREAGVSRQTVSRAINDKGEISPETRARILRVVRDLGYRPNSVARGLKTMRTSTIGLVVPDIANPFFAEVARGAADVAHGNDYGVLLCNTNENSEREWAALRMLESHLVDGVVLVSSRLPEERLREVVARWRPLVTVNRRCPPDMEGTGSVLVREAEAAEAAVRHLHARGHSQIGFLAGSPMAHSSRERRKGYFRALAALGQPQVEDWCVDCQPTIEGGVAAARRLLKTVPDINALLTYNDLVALGAKRACSELGRRVPEDCALIGWDDIVFASHVSPALTTMRMPKHEIGRQAMAVLLRLMDASGEAFEELPNTVWLEAELVLRESA